MVSDSLIKAIIILISLFGFMVYYIILGNYLSGLIAGILTLLMLNLTEHIRKREKVLK